ncbi:MAG TPA: ATP-dependent DNA helicase UvrD2 [Actinomycetota bacterium]|nr:ATP-dependent DNA helicase UvrD2 [Actinomycetota bacterium]
MVQPEEILAPLDPDQRMVAQATTGPVVVLAGAGTGKTRALTHRVAYGVATGVMDPRRSLVVTFTTRAAGEFARRLRAMGVDRVRVRTVHSEALRQLQWMWPRTVGGSLPRIQASKIGLVSAALTGAGIRLDDAGRRDVTSEIERAKAVGLAPDQVHDDGVLGERLAEVYQRYEDAKAAAGVLDFEDILLLNAGLIRDNLTVAEQVRQWCRWITVDEYQDVSPLQQQVIEGWLGDRDELCVVGDPAQTIYTFAGARSDYLLGFRSRWPGATALRLTRSYRCSPQIVELANKVLSGGDVRGRLQLISQREPGPQVRTRVYDTEQEEAAGVAARIKDLLTTIPAEQIAILVRINAVTARFERELHALGIPYSVRGSARFMQRPEVKRAVSLLRVAAKQPGEGDVVDRVAAALEPVGYSPQPPLGQAQREEWESLAALVTLARDHATLPDLIADLENRAEHDDAPVAAAITLASLHSAKGLEWDAVFLPGMYEGGLPLRYQGEFVDLEEERRLFYVGVTRARDVLELSYASSGSRREQRSPSRFLPEDRSARPVPKRTARKTPVCRVCGKRLSNGTERALGTCRGCPSDVSPELVEQLRAWRSTVVAQRRRETGKALPAFLVATDAVLIGIARQRPASRSALAAVRGIQKSVVADHGEELLAIVADHPG